MPASKPRSTLPESRCPRLSSRRTIRAVAGTNTVELAPVGAIDRPVLDRLMQLYRYDMAGFRGYELDDDGTIPYRYLDNYFAGEGREACFIRHGSRLAGFTMTSPLDRGERSVSEFFVVRHHRRHGVGLRAAVAMFGRHPGRWVLAFDANNGPAAAFWPTVVASVAVDGVRSTPKPSSAAFPGTELRFGVA